MAESDHESREREARIDLRKLPKILELRARAVRYEKARIFYEGRDRQQAKEAVEIDVETEKSIPQAAVMPVLQIGKVRILEAEKIGDRTYRFFAFRVKEIVEGDAVAWCWPDEPAGKSYPTGHRLTFKGREGDKRGKSGDKKK